MCPVTGQGVFERGKPFDATPASHPVLQPVRSAEQATQAFDVITYGKGAAVITMLESTRPGGAAASPRTMVDGESA